MNQKISRFFPELLIACILLLLFAAILFHGYSKSREKAKMVPCLTNVYQIAQAMNMYRMDYDDTYVSGSGWWKVLRPYTDRGKQKDFNIWFCPVRENVKGHDYGLNWFVAGKDDAAISDATKIVLIGDVWGTWNNSWVWWINDIRFNRFEHNRNPADCHLGRTCFAFCDGHVKALPHFQLTAGNWSF